LPIRVQFADVPSLDLSTFVHRSFPFFNTNTVVQLWWPFIREDPVLFHVVLLLAALSYEQLTPETDSRRSKMLMTESIRLLKDRVLDDTLGTTDQTIVAVANLLTIEVSLDRPDFEDSLADAGTA
jgi:hypothetical protein